MTETNNYKWNNNASGMEVVGRERTSFKIDDFSSLPDSLVPGEERRGAGVCVYWRFIVSWKYFTAS
jgi:hypothetical protein